MRRACRLSLVVKGIVFLAAARSGLRRCDGDGVDDGTLHQREEEIAAKGVVKEAASQLSKRSVWARLRMTTTTGKRLTARRRARDVCESAPQRYETHNSGGTAGATWTARRARARALGSCAQHSVALALSSRRCA